MATTPPRPCANSLYQHIFYTFAVAPCLVACGSGEALSSDGGSNAVTTMVSTSDPGTSTTETDSESASESETSGGSMSATETTSTTELTTEGPSTTDPTGTDTDPGPDCAMPPPGYPGPMDASCEAEPAVGMFNPIVEWQKSTWDEASDWGWVMSVPIAVPLTDDNNDGSVDTDDIPDLVFVTFSGNGSQGVLRALSGDGGEELWSSTGNGIADWSSVAAGDIDGDGLVELITTTSSREIMAFEHDGTFKWKSSAYTNDMVGHGSAAAISDMDGDGTPEIIVGRVILNADGSLRASGSYGLGGTSYGSASFAVDLDQNGTQEVVVGNAVYAIDGSALWHNDNLSDGFPAVADFDLDGVPEIAVVGPGTVRLMTNTGAVLWDIPIPGGGGGAPTIADFDGDGEPEIGVAAKFAYIMVDGDGTIVWENATEDDSSSVTGSSVYDFEGDGVADVVYSDEEHLWVFSGLDGTVKLQWAEHNNGTLLEYPIVVDIDGDNEVEIVVIHSAYWGSATGVTVLGDADNSWRPGRKTWNQHAYSITNVTDDGGIPAQPEPNWLQYNNFRSGDLSPPDGTAIVDLTVEGEQCETECDDNLLSIWAHLGNVGASPLTAGAQLQLVGIYNDQETVVETVDFNEQLPAGQFADAILFTVDPAPYDHLVVRAIANEPECNLDNNELTFEAPFCGLPVPE